MRTCSVLAVLVLSASGFASEKWADPRLKPPGGVLLWLDATRQPEAWQLHGKPALASNSLLDVWYDASGQGQHLKQRLRDSQPRLIRAGERAVVRFDGKDDFLGLTGQRRTLEKFTLFF